MIKDLQWISSLKEFDRIRNIASVTTVVCLNMNTWSIVHRNEKYKEIFERSFVLCDGFWANKLVRLLGRKVDVFTGPDFFIDEISSDNAHRHLMLGATHNKLLGLKEYLQEKGVKKEILIESLPFCNVADFDYDEIASNIIHNDIDIVWVVLGAPKQEYFSSELAKRLSKLQTNSTNSLCIIAVGAVADFYSKYSEVSRAPLYYQRLGLEWLWRLRHQPWKTLTRILNEIYSVPLILFKELSND
jgi:N-acetylglucosaminyldiphosphoundecaprenol N-acetyl-beta-D-mannosaminyltransferase